MRNALLPLVVVSEPLAARAQTPNCTVLNGAVQASFDDGPDADTPVPSKR